jgi:hypothetical protein
MFIIVDSIGYISNPFATVRNQFHYIVKTIFLYTNKFRVFITILDLDTKSHRLSPSHDDFSQIHHNYTIFKTKLSFII